MRSPRRWLLLLAGLLAAGNLGFTFARSGIPFGLAGRIERVEVRGEKHPGLDDVHLLTIGGREIHLDAEIADVLREGDEVHKAAWSTTLVTPRGDVALGVSRDFRRMLLAMPLLLLLAWVLLRRTREA